MPLSNAGRNAIKTYGERKYPMQAENMDPAPMMQDQEMPMYQDQATQAPQAPSKPKLMQYLQPTPTRDVQAEDAIKRRAKINALGKIFGSIGQISSMASGGDATLLEDNSTPFLRNQSQMLDNDYKNQLSQHYNRLFQVEQGNNQLENQWAMRDQDRDFTRETRQDDKNFRREERNEDRDFRREERAEDRDFRREERNDAQSFQERMQDKQFANTMRQLGVRNNQELQQKMWDVGVDPGSKTAMRDFLAKTGERYESTTGYNNARSNWNNNAGKKGGVNINNDPQFQEAFRRGREQQLTQLRGEFNRMVNSEAQFGEDPKVKEQKLKYIIEQIKAIETLKADTDNPLVVDLYELGSKAEKPSEQQSWDPSQAMPYYNQGKDFAPKQGPARQQAGQPENRQQATPMDEAEADKIFTDLSRQVKANKSRILAEQPDWTLINNLVEQAMSTGLYNSPQEAFNQIIEAAEKY